MGFYSSKEWLGIREMHPGGIQTTNWLLDHGNLQKEDCVLDLCCGRGDSIRELTKRGVHTIGADHSLEALKNIPAKTELVSCEAWNLPFSESFFQAVLCECSLTLMENRIGEVIKEIVRILKPDGRLLLSDLYAKESGHGITTKEEWEQVLRVYGMERVAWQDETAALHQYAMSYLWERGEPFPLCACGTTGQFKLKDVGYFVGIWRKIDG